MNIVVWIGKDANQKALANKIHQKFPLAAIVVENKKIRRRITAQKLISRVFEKLFLSIIGGAWFGMLDYYQKKFPTYPGVALLQVENINSDDTYHFTKKFTPDLVIVSGTRMVKEKLLSISPSIGILNLHTGISPYIKGGPNCTNWCIATKQFHLIGNTIMWIDKGIDTGNLMATEFTKFTGEESLLDVHIKVMEHAHSLYVSSIEEVSRNRFNNIPQNSIGIGVTYYNKQWGLKEKMRLVKNFPHFKKAVLTGEAEKNKTKIITFPLNGIVS
jgi:methionyl-tRNA formyltransferase